MGFKVWVLGLGPRVPPPGCTLKDCVGMIGATWGYMNKDPGLWFRLWGLGLRDLRFRTQGLASRSKVYGARFGDSGFRF